MITDEDKKKALVNPNSIFKHPADVIACKEGSRQE